MEPIKKDIDFESLGKSFNVFSKKNHNNGNNNVIERVDELIVEPVKHASNSLKDSLPFNTYKSSSPAHADSSWLKNVDYEFYQSVSEIGNLYGECVWFARGRAIEIMSYSDMFYNDADEKITFIRNLLADGGDWFDSLPSDIFTKSTDLYSPRPGSIVSWSGGTRGFGHVGIIEDVRYGEDGKVSQVLLTDTWNGTRDPSLTKYSCRWMDMESLKVYNVNRPGLYSFNGYVYLLD